MQLFLSIWFARAPLRGNLDNGGWQLTQNNISPSAKTICSHFGTSKFTLCIPSVWKCLCMTFIHCTKRVISLQDVLPWETKSKQCRA